MTTATTDSDPKLRTIVAGAIGNALEWYDFALFGFFAPIISQLFFPSENHLAALLDTFGVFALGFFMRPIGGLIFGHIGDRLGRKRALEISVLLMAIPTVLVGLLPTYHQIGLAAPLLLTLIRMLQGISVGGEFIGSMSFLGEHAPPGRRGFLGSWSSCSAGVGNLLGCGIAALMTGLFSREALHDWGWRLPFWCALLGGIMGVWMRLGIAESPCFKQAAAVGDVAVSPIRQALREDRAAILTIMGLALMMSIAFYMPWVWFSTWLAHINRPHLPEFQALLANTIAMTVMLVCLPLGGALSDRVGRKPVIVVGGLVCAALAYPMFALPAAGTFMAALTAQLIFAVPYGLTGGAVPVTFVELFPTRTRYSGIAIGYNGALALFGGTTPWVATWLIAVTGYVRAPAFYLIGAALITTAVAARLKDRYDQPLR